ncbi:unnamed protein product [Symbiodinium sp. KB8]|nr:unnamed protein product [Symbiodinium sp. KB8]
MSWQQSETDSLTDVLSSVRTLSKEDDTTMRTDRGHSLSSLPPWPRIVTVALSLVLILGVVLFEGRPRAAISRISHRTTESDEIEAYVSELPNAEVVECHLTREHQRSLVMLASTALESPAAMRKFVAMVRKLPGKTEADPPSLFSGLKVLFLEDAGLLKSSFWNPADANFNNSAGLNYQKMASRSGLRLNPKMISAWTNGFSGLDGGWSYDNGADVGIGGIGFDASDFTYASIFDLCATEQQAQALFELQSKHIVPWTPMVVDSQHPCIAKFEAMLSQVSIVFANGGNPDLLGFVLMKFAPQLGEMIKRRVQNGELLYMGRSAGAMAASRDFAMTYEPNPMLAETLLDGSTDGLSLAGSCALRPHASKKLWNVPGDVFGHAAGQQTVRVANGDGLFCDQGHCVVAGKTSRSEPDAFSTSKMHLERVVEAYRHVYRGYRPKRPNLVESSMPERPNCRLVLSGKKPLVALASSGLEAPDAREAFDSLVRDLPPTEASTTNHYQGLKVLVLDDGALLTTSFWNSLDQDFANPNAINYVKTGIRLSPETVRLLTNGFSGLSPGWVLNAECSGACGGLGDFGFDDGAFTHASAFDMCATFQQKEALFRLQSQGLEPEVDMTVETNSPCIEQFYTLLEQASVLVASSGNADLLGYVYRIFAPQFGEKIVQRVQQGSLIFLGLGAGAMAFGENFAAAATSPALQTLLKGDLQGLKLAGQCAVIPGWDSSELLWDLTSSLFQDAMQNVDIVGLPDGALLLCRRQSCEIRGSVRQRPARVLDGPDSPGTHRGRLADVMAKVFG